MFCSFPVNFAELYASNLGVEVGIICRSLPCCQWCMLWESQEIKWWIVWKVCGSGQWIETLWSWCYSLFSDSFFPGMHCHILGTEIVVHTVFFFFFCDWSFFLVLLEFVHLTYIKLYNCVRVLICVEYISSILFTYVILIIFCTKEL